MTFVKPPAQDPAKIRQKPDDTPPLLCYHLGEPEAFYQVPKLLRQLPPCGTLSDWLVRTPYSRLARMIHKTHSPLAGHTRVIFELPAALWADRICVIGDFNHWQPQRTSLSQERDGCWQATLDLPVGRQYQFCYMVDGEQRTDFQAVGDLLVTQEGPTSLVDLA